MDGLNSIELGLERPCFKYYTFYKKLLFHYMTGYAILNNYHLFACFDHFIEM